MVRIRRLVTATTAGLLLAGTVTTTRTPTDASRSSAFVVCPDPGKGCSSSNHNEVRL